MKIPLIYRISKVLIMIVGYIVIIAAVTYEAFTIGAAFYHAENAVTTLYWGFAKLLASASIIISALVAILAWFWLMWGE